MTLNDFDIYMYGARSWNFSTSGFYDILLYLNC